MSTIMDKITFGQWLAKQREERGWAQSELARRSGVHRQTINKIENSGTLPNVESFIALAGALGKSPIELFRAAGLMPSGTKDQIAIEDWMFLLNQLPASDQEELRKIALMKIERNRQ